MEKVINIKNEVIIIGGDHHNTLSVVRSMGRNKLSYKILIHSNEKEKKMMMICHSRFGKNLDVVDETESDIYKWLIDHKSKQKQVIITCSDLAEYAVDNNHDQLSKYYYMPGFSNHPGMVTYMMNKFNQKKWADKNNLPMAKSWHVDLKKSMINTDNIEYPCIVKPNISAFGKKSDISICNNEEELKNVILKFKNENYEDVIIQKFIKKLYEVCAIGVIVDEKKKYYGRVIKKDRENPPKGGGSLTFAHFINDNNINAAVNAVIDVLYKEKYRGLYDIEFLVCEEGIYLNEINFRNSGNNYALLKNGIDAPFIYYLDALGKKIDNIKIKTNNMYFMDELNEIMLMKKKGISLFTFIRDFIKSSAYAKLDIKDLGIMTFLIKKKFGRKRRIEN